MTELKTSVDQLNPESVKAYSNTKVITALKNTDWFTPEYIENIRNTEEYPERNGLGPFKDSLLGDFFLFPHIGKFSDNNKIFLGVRLYLTQGMVGSQGHPFRLDDIEFIDDEIVTLAESLEVDKNYSVDRGMIGQVTPLFQCIIAPEKIRKKATRVICSWGDTPGGMGVKRDVFLWSQVIKKGIQSYLSSRNL